MNKIPKTIKHTPISMSKTKINLGEKWIVFINCPRVLSQMSIDMVGNFITCAVIAALSSLLKVAKFVLS